MRWTDVFDIAIALDEQYADSDPLALNFVDLRNMVLNLDGFEDDPDRCGEKILEAIQAAWIEESQ
jgi:FeS assembly protein IscX